MPAIINPLNPVMRSSVYKTMENGFHSIACLAMNNLPSRYTHHSVDMAFYLTEKERAEMNSQIAVALNNAIDKVMD